MTPSTLAMQSVLEPALNSLASPGRGNSRFVQILTNALMVQYLQPFACQAR